MTEIGGQRLDDGVLMVDQHADGAIDQFDALFGGPGLAGEIGGALLFQDRADE
ncbi:hypothetical protein D9M73_208590 [compost metagenome]